MLLKFKLAKIIGLLIVALFPRLPHSAVNINTSYISFKPFCARPNGVQACVAIVHVFDDNGDPIQGKNVQLQSSRGTIDVIGPTNSQTTDASGTGTFTITTVTEGEAEITAVVDGLVIRKGMSDDGAVGIWTFNGQAKDISGNTHHGTLNGNPTYVGGKYGNAISLDGNDWVSIAHTSKLNELDAVTMDAWIYLENTQQNTMVLQKSSNLNYGLEIGANMAMVHKHTQRTTLMDATSSANALSTGRWHHVVGIFEGTPEDLRRNTGRCHIYVDNTLLKTDRSGRYIIRRGTGELNIGRAPGGGKNFTGYIDEVKIYNRPLYESEIERNFNFSTKVYFNLEPPQGLVTNASQPECTILNWDRVPNNNLTSIKIYRSKSPGVQISDKNLVREINPTWDGYYDWFVQDGVTYYYVLTSISHGNESAPSAEVTITPTRAAAAPGWYKGDMHVHSNYSWDAAGNNLDSRIASPSSR